jgi:hypothetical protein
VWGQFLSPQFDTAIKLCPLEMISRP